MLGTSKSKKGQLTIFIIVGVVLLFFFGLMYYLVQEEKVHDLSLQQEEVFTQLFSKDKINFYIDDCLIDELEEGLMEIGNQGGKIFEEFDESEGIKEVVDLYNDTLTTNVSYGISYFPHIEENIYPCKLSAKGPDFCKYEYEKTTGVNFGTLTLGTNKIEKELSNYIHGEVVECIKDLIKANISDAAIVDVDPEEVTVDVSMKFDGIKVEVDYPLKLIAGDEELFHLQKFEFFYDGRFKDFFSAIRDTLVMEKTYANFDLEKDYLNEGFLGNGAVIKAPLTKLLVEMESQINSYDKGSDLFIFKSKDLNLVKKNELYRMQIARQNRPPALDYISRKPCESGDIDYDYLVVPGTEELSVLEIDSEAHDVDEDLVVYSFSSSIPLEYEDGTPVLANQWVGEDKKIVFNSSLLASSDVPLEVTVGVRDEHGLEDWQDIRVLVDKPLVVDLNVEHGYNDLPKVFEGKSIVSKEDPFFIYVDVPVDATVDLELDVNKCEGLNCNSILEPGTKVENGCKSFPGEYQMDLGPDSKCDLNDYDKLVTEGTEQLIKDYPLNDLSDTADSYYVLEAKGTYCSDDPTDIPDVTALAKVELLVVPCMPYMDTNYNSFPWSEKVAKIFSDENLNPFLASHSCCTGDLDDPTTWSYNSDTCYTEGKLGCFDENNPLYLSEFEQKCSGNRGNICDGGTKQDLLKVDDNLGNYMLWIGASTLLKGAEFVDLDNYDYIDMVKDPIVNVEMDYVSGNICGITNEDWLSEISSCELVDKDCQGLPEGVVILEEDGIWCEYDCKACDSEIVDKDKNSKYGSYDDYCKCDETAANKGYGCYDFDDGEEGVCVDSILGKPKCDTS